LAFKVCAKHLPKGGGKEEGNLKPSPRADGGRCCTLEQCFTGHDASPRVFLHRNDTLD